MIGYSKEDEIERALAELTEEQEDELHDELALDDRRHYWSNTRCNRWLYQVAIQKGYLNGPT